MPCIYFNVHLSSLGRSNGIFFYFYFSDGRSSAGESREEWIPALFWTLNAYLCHWSQRICASLNHYAVHFNKRACWVCINVMWAIKIHDIFLRKGKIKVEMLPVNKTLLEYFNPKRFIRGPYSTKPDNWGRMVGVSLCRDICYME